MACLGAKWDKCWVRAKKSAAGRQIFGFRLGERVGFERCACSAAWINGKKPVFIPLGGFLDVHKSYPSYAHYGSFL